MYCPYCGSEIPAGTNVCPNCYAEVDAGQASAQEPAPEPVAEPAAQPQAAESGYYEPQSAPAPAPGAPVVPPPPAYNQSAPPTPPPFDSRFYDADDHTDDCSFKSCFLDTIAHHYADFSGCATRARYWRFQVFYGAVIYLILGLFGIITGIFRVEALSFTGFVVSFIVSLALFIPNLALNICRLRDTGKPWPYFFISWIPILNIWYLIMMCEKGEAVYHVRWKIIDSIIVILSVILFFGGLIFSSVRLTQNQYPSMYQHDYYAPTVDTVDDDDYTFDEAADGDGADVIEVDEVEDTSASTSSNSVWGNSGSFSLGGKVAGANIHGSMTIDSDGEINGSMWYGSYKGETLKLEGEVFYDDTFIMYESNNDGMITGTYEGEITKRGNRYELSGSMVNYKNKTYNFRIYSE